MREVVMISRLLAYINREGIARQLKAYSEIPLDEPAGNDAMYRLWPFGYLAVCCHCRHRPNGYRVVLTENAVFPYLHEVHDRFRCYTRYPKEGAEDYMKWRLEHEKRFADCTPVTSEKS